MIDFFVEGRPYAKQSFRYTRAGLHYQTENVKSWQGIISMKAKEVWHKDPLIKNGLAIRLDFYLRGNTADIDNLTKAVLDGLQGVVYKNDRQIYSLIATKIVTPVSVAGVRIRIGAWDVKL